MSLLRNASFKNANYFNFSSEEDIIRGYSCLWVVQKAYLIMLRGYFSNFKDGLSMYRSHSNKIKNVSKQFITLKLDSSTILHIMKVIRRLLNISYYPDQLPWQKLPPFTL